MIVAHPSKSGGDWWYGTLVRDGKSGFFPNTYVVKTESCMTLSTRVTSGSLLTNVTL